MRVQSNMVQVSDSHRVPTWLPVSFVLNGATANAIKGGHVESITRLVTSGPAPFFRVRFTEAVPGLTAENSVITWGVQAVEGSDATVNVSRVGFTANPANPLEVGRELDVQIMESGVAVDTAGIIVNLNVWIDAHARA